MTYTDLEKLISKIILDNTVKDKSKAVISKIKELEDLSSYYEIHFFFFFYADGGCVNKTDNFVSVYGDSIDFDETHLIVYRDTKEVFCCNAALVYYVNKV